MTKKTTGELAQPQAKYIAIFQQAPLNIEIIKKFQRNAEFTEYFNKDKSLRWGVLIESSNGRTFLEINRAEESIELPKNKKPSSKGLHVSGVHTENTGGHVMVDYVQLKSGKVIGVSSDCVCAYPSMDALYCDYAIIEPCGTIDLSAEPDEDLDMDASGVGYYIESISTETGDSGEFDLIHLKNGQVLRLDNESVCLYDNKDIHNSEPIEAAGKLDLTVEIEFDPDSDDEHTLHS